MTRNVVVHPAARCDIVDCAERIAEDSFDAAMRFIDAAEATATRIATDPAIGRMRERESGSPQGVRSWAVDGFANHLIFYTFDDRSLVVVRVVHGARDLDQVFDQG